MIKGFIFDMDGTMIDNMMTHHHAWQAILKEVGLELTIQEIKEKIHGINEEIIKRLFGNKFNDKEIQEIARRKEAKYRELFKEHAKLLPGLELFLAESLNLGIPMSIGTAAPPENVNFVFENIPIRDKFHGVVHSAMVEKGKPNPEVFDKAAATMGLTANECIVFEDSPTGAHAAYNSGAKSIIVLTTHTEREFQDFPNIISFIHNFQNLQPTNLIDSI